MVQLMFLKSLLCVEIVSRSPD